MSNGVVARGHRRKRHAALASRVLVVGVGLALLILLGAAMGPVVEPARDLRDAARGPREVLLGGRARRSRRVVGTNYSL